ncbi:Holliday junction branch migration DNA helicase RuvB [Candidatus Dojkabacteria bacterium]|nr:Holliday junction branch migration DNA helicase RuvB [Candidatus Dojkabacteria bacterium]
MITSNSSQSKKTQVSKQTNKLHDEAASIKKNSEVKESTIGIRPKTLKDVIGRKSLCESLSVLIGAAKRRHESVDHILFHGPPGLGKTTYANIVANEMGSKIHVTSGPAIERQGDLAAILTSLHNGDVLFIDEIHRLNHTIEEVLYPAMEDFKLDIIVGKGPSARSLRLSLEKFTLIGATTRIGMISSPLRDRFGMVQRLDYFTDEELRDIVLRASKIMKIRLFDTAAMEIAKRARGTGRIALRLLRRVRDFSTITFTSRSEEAQIDEITAVNAMETLGVDKLGLDDLDRKILEVIIDKFEGGPVGLSTIAAAVSDDVETISGVYEPYLMQKGLLNRTKRGRVATRKAYEHLGRDYVVIDNGFDISV